MTNCEHRGSDWTGKARRYLKSFVGHNSIILMIEQQSKYINVLIGPVLEARKQGKTLSLSPKPEKVKEYNAEIQSELQKSSFNDPNCQSWYKTESGRITNNWSRNVIDYQNLLSTVNYDDYDAEGSGSSIVRQKPQSQRGVIRQRQDADGSWCPEYGGFGRRVADEKFEVLEQD